MVFFRRPIFVALALAGAIAARAQTPVVTQAIPAQTLVISSGPVTIDLRNYFSEPTITGQVVQFDTILGKFNIELFASDAPKNVANFLSYANSGAYTNTIVHRSVPGFVIQGGGYKALNSLDSIPRSDPVALEYKIANTRGTIAMARSDGPNTATSEWFVNLVDNTSNLAPGGVSADGYTVFGRVLGTGMTVIDAIAALPVRSVQANSPFTTLPLYNFDGNNADASNLVLVRTTQVAPIYPTSTNLNAVIEFNVVTLNGSSVVTAALSGSTLTVTPIGPGAATISVRAADVNGNFVSSSFNVTVAAATSAPVITTQPIAQTVTTGSTVAFSAAATGVPTPTYQWFRGSDKISGATSPTLILSGTTGTNAALTGNYSVTVTNSVNTVTSAVVPLSFTNNPDFGHLTNLSVLATLTPDVQDFTVATVVGGGVGGTKPTLFRAAGPTLGAPPPGGFGIPGTVGDTKLELFDGSSTMINANDDWGGTTVLRSAMASVGAFAYAADNSKDSAVFLPQAAAGSYSEKVSGVGGGTGLILAEIYDATPGGTFTSATHRLLDVSVLKKIATDESLTVGFNIGGSTSRTVMIRAVGPTLTTKLGIPGTMADPQLKLYSAQTVLATNDDWGGDASINAVFTAVGAFKFDVSSSKDAVIVATLSPGNYTAVVTGGNKSSGLTVVEVYDVP